MNTVICAIAKNENNYINEWANYYITLGFNHIYLYDNNDSTTEYVGNYIDEAILNKITIINKQNIHEQGLQWKVYQEFYNKFNTIFDWCLFCDIDEFLTGVKNINEFLSQELFNNVEQIRIKWCLFGDDDIIERDITQPVFNTFKKQIMNNKELINQGKAIVRGGLQNITIKSCHYAFKSFDNDPTRYELISCLPSGTPSFGDTFEIKTDYSGESVYLNHYMTKSLSEFIQQKFNRGDAVWKDRVLTFDYFWQINKKTKQKLNFIKSKFYDIDLVVPYVDSSDINWINVFNKYSKNIINTNQTIAKNRFRSSDIFFRYFFRSIAQNMPWINNIFLIVQSYSQVPSWLDTSKIKIILHEQFIPQKYLPTFNSGTIEMFLHRIPGLTEHFIYANDDFYLLKTTKPTDFFRDNKCLFNIITTNLNPDSILSQDSAWWHMCQNNHDIIYNTIKAIPFKRLGHEFRPYLKSKFTECFNLYKKEILNSISQFRDSKNLTCYLFSLYLDTQNLRLESSIKKDALTFDLSPKKIIQILDTADMVCVNDNSADKNIYENNIICERFAGLFKTKCQFEITDLPIIPKIKPITKEKSGQAFGQSGAYLYF